MTRWWRAEPAAALAGVLAWHGSARAQAPSGETTRPIVAAIAAAPDACFDGNSLAESIATWLGKGEISPRIAILVRRPTTDAVRFTVERDAKLVGERDLVVGQLPCPDLRAALSLAIAIAIDSTLLTSLGIEPPPTTPTEREMDLDAPVTVPRRPVAPQSSVEDQPRPPRRHMRLPEERAGFGFAVEAMALFGVLPGPAIGAAPRISYSPLPWLDMRLSALGTTRAQTVVGGGTASASLLTGRAEGCVLGSSDEVRAGGCVGAAAGSLSAEGSGLSPAYSPTIRWAAATVRAEARYPASSVLALLVGVTGFVPLLRAELQVVDSKGQIVDTWKAPAAGFGVSLGGELSVW